MLIVVNVRFGLELWQLVVVVSAGGGVELDVEFVEFERVGFGGDGICV